MKNLFIPMFFFFPLLIHSQITFEENVGGDSYDFGRAILQMADGGYFIAGNTESFGVEEYDVCLIRTNENGDTLWTKTYGGPGADYGNAIIETGDGDYLIAGTTETADDLYSGVYLIKTNQHGDTLWTKSFWKGGYSRASALCKTMDGGYMVAGSFQPHSPYSNDFFLLKANAEGDTLWTKTYGGDQAEWAAAVLQTTDNGYLLAGTTESFGAGEEDIYVVKTDSNGVVLWTKTYGGPGSDYATDMIKAGDDYFIVAGYTDNFGAGYDDAYIIKINGLGDTLWTNTFGGSSHDKAYAIHQAMDQGFILVGNTNTYATEQHGYDAWMIRTDENGDSLWTRVYGGIHTDGFNDVIQTSDKGFITAGYTYSFGLTYSNIYLVKTNENGLQTSISEPQQNRLLRFELAHNYPNPFNSSTVIRYHLSAHSDGGSLGNEIELNIYNILGKKVVTLVSERKRVGTYEVKWDASTMPSGLYICRLKVGSLIKQRKMLLIK